MVNGGRELESASVGISRSEAQYPREQATGLPPYQQNEAVYLTDESCGATNEAGKSIDRLAGCKNFRRLVTRYEFHAHLFHGFAQLDCLVVVLGRF